MILVNGEPAYAGKDRFPDGTFALHLPEPEQYDQAAITWLYEAEEETVALYYIVQHIRRQQGIDCISLFLPYCPNARMDRVQHDYEVFTLKYFAEFLNMLKLDEIAILDPHSSVTPALIDNCHILTPETYIYQAMEAIDDPDLLLFYPDEGAMKRYSDLIKAPYGFGIKRRCWETGEIMGLDVVCEAGIEGKNVLIVDDICCRGGTFLHSAKELRKLRVKNVFAFCTHCEHTIFEGDLLTTDFVDHIYTTDSIFRWEHEKITAFPLS